MKSYLVLLLSLITSSYVLAQKAVNSILHPMDKRIVTLSGLVSDIAIKKKTGVWNKSGTALFVKHENNYFAVTAKHCFIEGSTQSGKTIPTIENTCDEAAFFTKLDGSGQVDLLHSERLHDGQWLNFHVYNINETQAIDVAALKLTNPSEHVKSLAIDSNNFDNSGIIYYSDELLITGFPSHTDNTEESITTSFSSKELLEMLDDEHQYYFMMPGIHDLNVRSAAGFSGAPILDKDKNKIIGFVAGENKKFSLIYGIYAKYMSECLNKFSN